MPPTLTYPTEVKPGWFEVVGTDFPKNTYVAIVVKGIGWGNKVPVAPDGTFKCGGPLASTTPDGIYDVVAVKNGTKTPVLASGTVTVKRVVTPPPPPADTTPPSVINPRVDTITQTSAIARWGLSENGTGQTEYGYTVLLGSLTTFEPALLPAHSQVIRDLEPGRTVYWRPRSKDAAGNEVLGPIASFTTLPVIVDPPPPNPTPGEYAKPEGPLLVTTDNAVIEWRDIRGGIIARGTKAKPLRNLTIRNVRTGGGRNGIDLQYVDGFTIEDSDIEDHDYAGILSTSARNGSILRNRVKRIGINRLPADVASNNNCYGIALSRNKTTDLVGDFVSSDILVKGNLVEDVWHWHGLDTHAGVRITFEGNTVKRCARAIFITTDDTNRAKDIVIRDNILLEGVDARNASGGLASGWGGTNATAITLYNADGVTITGNRSATSYQTPMVDNLGGASTGVVETGTTIVNDGATWSIKCAEVTSVATLRTALADDHNGLIIAKPGKYTCNTGSGAGSLWIGSVAAGGAPLGFERKHLAYVRSEVKHAAIIEGGYLNFQDGAHDQIWDGFRHSNMTVTSNGVITVGGYTPRRAPHHIICRNFWVDDTCKAYVGTTSDGVKHGPDGAQDHAIYPAHAIDDGPHAIVFEDFRIDCINLNGALHQWHPEGNKPGFQPYDITYRRGVINDPWWGLVGGHPKPVTGIRVEDVVINRARRAAISWQDPIAPGGVTLLRVTTVQSKAVCERNFSKVPMPPGVPGMVIKDCVWG